MTTTLDSNQMLTQLAEVHKAHVASFETAKATLASAKGDMGQAAQQWKNSTDPVATKFREQIKKLQEKFNEAAAAAVPQTKLTDAEVAKLTTELGELAQQAKASRKAVTLVAESFNLNELADTLLEGVAQVGSGRGRKPGTSTGTGVPRASVDLLVTGGSFAEPKEFADFTKLGQHFAELAKEDESGDAATTLRKQYAVAAGVEYTEIKSAADVVEWDFSYGDNKYHVVATKRARKNAKTAAV